MSRTIRVILDLLTVKFLLNYSTRPLQIFGLFGLIAGAAGSVILAWLGYVRLFTTQGIGDRPLLLLGMLLVFIGVQLLTFGLLAELLARHLSRVAEQAGLRHSRDSSDTRALAG